MGKFWQTLSKSELLFISVTIVYGLLILFNSKYFSPHDDFLFLQAFDENKWRGIQDSEFYSGRFNLLHGLDLFLATFINKYYNSIVYYLISSFIFFINSLILFKIIKESLNIKIRGVHLLLFTLLLFSTSFTSIYFRILYPERYIILLISFIYLLHLHFAKSTWHSSQKIAFILIVFFCNYVMHLKEPSILCIIFIGIGNILFYLSNKFRNRVDKNNLYIGISLILSGVIAIMIYFLIIYPKLHSRYGANGIPFFINLLKSIVEWTIADPVIFILFIPIFAYKMYNNFKNNAFDFHDIFSFGAIGYMLTFFITGMAYSQHYLTPLYVLILPFLFKNFKTNFRFKYLLILTIILQFGNISLGINDIVFQKYNNLNFSSVIEKMDSITKHNYTINKTRTTFHVLGGKDQGNHFSHGALYFMNKKGNDDKMFDFASFETIADTAYAINIIEKPPYTFMNTNINKPVLSGDYVLYTPYTLLVPESDGINKILINSWNAPSYFGYLNFKDLIRLAVTKFYKNKIVIRDNKSFRVAKYELYRVK